MIPQHARLLFWDIDIDTFDHRAYPRYTIERVLKYGDKEDVAWMQRTFNQSVDQISIHMLHAEVLPSGWELAAKDLAARSVIDGFYLMHGVTLG